MRTPFLPIATIALLAACGDRDPTAPTLASVDAPPQHGVAVFGVTLFGPAGPVILVEGINDVGQTVGSRTVEAPVAGFRGWLYANGGFGDLPLPFLVLVSRAWGINASGLAVGQGDELPLAWEGGSFTLLSSSFAGTTHTGSARAVSDRGVIVGIEVDGSEARAVWWNGIGDPSPAILQSSPDGLTIPVAVNDAGLIVGNTELGPGTRAEAWAGPGAAPQPLRSFDGSTCSTSEPRGTAVGVRAVNQLGAIVGVCRVGGLEHAAYWSDRDAIPIDLDPDGFRNSSASDINELGQIVGSVDGQPVLWVREGPGFRRFDLGTPGSPDESAGASAINNTGVAVGSTTVGDLDRRAARWEVPVQVGIDVVPGNAGNRLKLDTRGTISVAVLGSRWLQVSGIDPQTLTLGNDDGQETPVARKKKGTPITTLTDVNRDGRQDLVAQFEKRTLKNNDDLVPGTQTLVLLGRFRDGRHLRGADVVQANP